ncbi:unnamed protein product [Prunus armeniaca]
MAIIGELRASAAQHTNPGNRPPKARVRPPARKRKPRQVLEPTNLGKPKGNSGLGSCPKVADVSHDVTLTLAAGNQFLFTAPNRKMPYGASRTLQLNFLQKSNSLDFFG